MERPKRITLRVETGDQVVPLNRSTFSVNNMKTEWPGRQISKSVN